jgi:aminopeptidase N
LSVWAFAGEEDQAVIGTQNLTGVFEFFEQTYGPYPYGTHAGSVSADWGPSAYGGMEHHPYWHVAREAMADEVIHAHEAAHGWYGNGVRIECWEDFVLSEGLATYLAARGLAAANPGHDVWAEYECALQFTCESATYNTQLLLDSCNEIDLLNHPLWGPAPYYKGAWFLREVAALVGEQELDVILADFFQANVGGSATMMDLVGEIVAASGVAEVDDLADVWLFQVECPIDTSTLCVE